MHWLLQNNYVDSMTGKLAWALQRMGRTILDFSVLPDQPLPALPLAAGAPFFFYGSTGLLQRMRTMPYAKDYIFGEAESLDQRLWQASLGPRLLNPTAQFLSLGELKKLVSKTTPPFFVRPVLDQKAFSGLVVSDGDLSPLYVGKKGLHRAHPDDMLLAMSSVVSNIAAEYRFVVLDGQVRLGSRYRLEGRLSPSPEVPRSAFESAQTLASTTLPASFIVMDVAILEDDSARIVEFNSVHSSGLYEIPPEEFVLLVEEAVAQRHVPASYGQRERPPQ